MSAEVNSILDQIATINTVDCSDAATVKAMLASSAVEIENAQNHIDACKLLKVRMQKYLDS